MNAYTGQAPDTIRSADWRASAPCKADPDAMYPGSFGADIDYAKSFCRSCPSVERCLQWALETGEEWGVWGGLSEGERRKLRRRKAAKLPVDEAEDTPRPATLAEAWKARTRPLDDEHLAWTGARCLYFQGATYTPNRATFIVSRGRTPDGQVLAFCGIADCVRPDHLTDARERDARSRAGRPVPNPRHAPCGTRSAYARHVEKREPVDDACRRAHNRGQAAYSRTGTTKVSA